MQIRTRSTCTKTAPRGSLRSQPRGNERLTLLSVLLALALPVACSGDDPDSQQRLTLKNGGVTLASVLDQAGTSAGLRLRAARELQSQRMTLISKGMGVQQFTRALRLLLSPSPDSGVRWKRIASAEWLLEESPRRRALREELRDLDLQQFRSFLGDELEWRRIDGPKHLEQARSSGNPTALPRTLQRYAFAALLEAQGETGLSRLLSGAPLALRVRDLPEDAQKAYSGFRRESSPLLKGLSAEEMGNRWIALQFVRHPTDPLGAHLVASDISPEGKYRGMTQVVQIPHVRHYPWHYPPFQLQPAPPDDLSRRVTLVLGKDPGERSKGVLVRRSLDQVLEEIAEGLGIQVVADGYLRASNPIPTNLEVRNYPQKRLFDTLLTNVWGVDWRFADAEEKILLVRSKAWWMEDAADVPQPEVDALRASLGPSARNTPLTALFRVAELSVAQTAKLIDCGVCPRAKGLLEGPFYFDAGVKPSLQFVGRLSDSLKKRALSPDGLPLAEAPQELVERFLAGTMILYGGVTPEFRAGLSISLLPEPSGSGASDGWTLRIGRPGERRPLYSGTIQAPPVPAATARE